MAARLKKSLTNAMTELERCDAEIHQLEVLLRSNHPDLEGLLRSLVDWCTERRLVRAARQIPKTGAIEQPEGSLCNMAEAGN